MRHRLPALLVVVVVAGGCVPHVLHGPQVEPGTNGVVSFTAGRNADLEDADVQFLPSLYAGLRHGWITSDSARGFSLGVQVPPVIGLFALEEDAPEVLLATSYADIYFEPLRRGVAGGSAGLGVLGSTDLVMPYVQYGRLDAGGEGWYTTQGMAFLGGDEWGRGTYWMPSLVRRDVVREHGNAMNFSLTGGIGSSERESEWFVLLGFTAEFGLPKRR